MTMCPTYAYINRTDGKFNPDMGFKRENAAIAAVLWDIAECYRQYLENPEADKYDLLIKTGMLYGGNEADAELALELNRAIV